MKVLFQCNAISPYRNAFFNELNKYVDLTVAYETENFEHTHRDKKWFEGMVAEYRKVKLDKTRFMLVKKGGNIKKLLKSEPFDVVILGHYLSPTGYRAIKYCKRHKIVFGVSADGAKAKPEKKIIYLVKKYLLKKSAFFLSPSRETDKYFEKYKVKGNVYRYNFTSLSNADILDFIERENSGHPTVLAVGQFIHRKGFDVLIKCADKINAKIVICGGQPTQEYLDLVKSDNIEFVGFKTKNEIGEYYRNADIFVLPTREDVWGLVINEAMNYSLPVVTTKSCVAGVELIENGVNGFLVDSEDENALVNALNTLADDYPLRIAMGEKSNKKIKNHTLENMAKRSFEVLNEVLDGRRDASTSQG